MNQFELSKAVLQNLHKLKLSPTAKLTLLAIADYYPNIYPSQQTLAKVLGISKKSVERAYAELRQLGLIITSVNQSQTLTVRFTDNFFTTVKMSAPIDKKSYSKNRQNGEQTNNVKQIKNKSFPNFQPKGIDYKKYEPITIKSEPPAREWLDLRYQLGIKC